MNKKIVNSEIIKNSVGHAIHVEKPEIFATIVKEYYRNK